MKKETYDSVAQKSLALNGALNELKACQAEKESLLALIDKMVKDGTLEKNAAQIREKMAANLARFKSAVAQIEKL